MSTTERTEPTFLDGNAAAGELLEIFALDVTAADGTCAGCGRVGPLAQAHLYGQAPGLVLRCPGCDHVLARIVTTARHVSLDLAGIRTLRVVRSGCVS